MNFSKIFKRGYTIFKEGQKPIDGIYLISDGEFQENKKFPQKSVDGQKSTTNILSLVICGPHQTLGLQDLYAPCMSTTVICHSTTARAYFLKKDDFERLL